MRLRLRRPRNNIAVPSFILTGAPFFKNSTKTPPKRDLFVHALLADYVRCQSPDARPQQIVWAFALKERR